MTAHGAKGREFDTVFIPGLEDKKWGNPRSRSGIPLPHIFTETPDENEDERRLFFVALTRARRKIFISLATTDRTGREKNPSIFWHELPENCVRDLPTDEIESETQKLLPIFLTGERNFKLTDSEKSILRERVQNFVWSASALQNYLDCPRRFLFQNLYRFPRRPVPAISLGVALHEALERFVRAGNFDAPAPLLAEFDRALRGQNLDLSEFKKLHEHGTEILKKYFEEKRESFADNAEFEFNFGKFSPEIDGIRITGKADKIEFLDEKRTHAKIIDYKSGRPRQIQHGDRLWRQLVFYDILARTTRPHWTLDPAELEFLTPDRTGKFSTKKYAPTPADREEVLNELRESDQKLKNLEFPLVENPKNDPDIDFWQSLSN